MLKYVLFFANVASIVGGISNRVNRSTLYICSQAGFVAPENAENRNPWLAKDLLCILKKDSRNFEKFFCPHLPLKP